MSVSLFYQWCPCIITGATEMLFNTAGQTFDIVSMFCPNSKCCSLQFDLSPLHAHGILHCLTLYLAKMQLGVIAQVTAAGNEMFLYTNLHHNLGMFCFFTDFLLTCMYCLIKTAIKYRPFVDVLYGWQHLCTFKLPAVVQISHFAKKNPFFSLPKWFHILLIVFIWTKQLFCKNSL